MVANYDKDSKINGIKCDICGIAKLDKFTYYSAKIDAIMVDKVMGAKGIADIDRRYLDLDFCEACFGKLKSQVMLVIKKREENKGKSQWSTSTQQKQNIPQPQIFY